MGYMWLRDPEHKQHRLVVIHYDGGVFAMSDPLQDVELANQTHTMLQQVLKSKYQLDVLMDVLLSNYRKSPENPFPIHDNDCLDVYKYVLKHENISPDHVIRSGDSAGAKMPLANCMRMRDSTPEFLPLGCLQYSPSVDFEEKGGDERTQELICSRTCLMMPSGNPQQTARLRGVGDGHLDLDTGLDRDRRDLLHDVRGGVQVDDTLVDAHLEAVPRVGTLTTRRLARGQTQNLGGETHGARHLQVLVHGATLEVSAHLLQVLHVTARERNANAVDAGLLRLDGLRLVDKGHVG
ncbi:hypothetical protein ON010_g17364 [Phytophthora cinnamomi]|nr:hypothetical protein ON010_g17364 [Phytophthora cinnamomi]